MKKLVCLALAMFMLLSLTACPSESTDNAENSSGVSVLETQSQTESDVPSKNEGATSSKKPSNTASLPGHKHEYEKTELTASCGEVGGTLYSCSCGESYMENAISPSYKHDFQEEKRNIGEKTLTVYKCSQCAVEALYVEEWWKYKAKFNEVRWYVMGKITPTQDGKGYLESDYEIVVCGNGAIEDYNEKAGDPLWRRFLGSKLKSVTVANGITSIGKNAFCYRSSKKQNVSFKIGGSVKAIKSGAIKLNINDVVLGEGVETVEKGAISGVGRIYLPKSIKACSDLGYRNNVSYYYKGDLDSLLNIEVENPGIAGSPTCTLKERCDWSSANNENPEYACAVILNSSKIGKGEGVFDGKTVKTDPESLKMYIE